ncbi:unnamed protein product [Sympodiomycopsis kandeliae]
MDSIRHNSDSFGGGAGTASTSNHLPPPHQHQHQHSSSSSSSFGAGVGAGSSSQSQPTASRHETQLVVNAIDSLGNKIGSQLSSLSVQLSSMLSLMSQLVEQQQQQQQQHPHPHPHPHPHSHPHIHQQPQASLHHSSINSTRQPLPRRDSGHPFAFDPGLDHDDTASSFHPDATRHDMPPHTADSSMTTTLPPAIQQQSGPSTNGMGIYLGGSDNGDGVHSRQISAADSSYHSHRSGGLPAAPPIPPPPSHSHNHLGDPTMLSHSLSFDPSAPSSSTAGPGMDAGPITSPRRPTSAYGSVRPFTAVDHSSRPAPPMPPAPPQQDQSHDMQDPHLHALSEHANMKQDDQDRMRVDFELQQHQQQQQHYDQSGQDFGRPPTRNPRKHPLDPSVGGGQHPLVDDDDQYHDQQQQQPHQQYTQQHNQQPSYPGQPHFSPFGHQPTSPPKYSSSLALAGEDLSSARRAAGRPSGPTIGALARKKSTSRDTPFAAVLPPRLDATSSHPMHAQLGYPSPGGGGAGSGGMMVGNDGAPAAPMGDFRVWANSPPSPGETKIRGLPEPKWRTLQSARLDLQRKTGRTMAKLGRLPLKDYLEVSQPEYLAARKTGRAAYNEWLVPLVRLAKQDSERVRACTNFIEYCHPMLSLCEGSFKARQLLQQIIDNAIDESTNAKKKAVPSGSQQQGQGGGGSTSTGSQSHRGGLVGSYDRGETPEGNIGGGGGGGGQHSSFSSPSAMNESSSNSSYFPTGANQSTGDTSMDVGNGEGEGSLDTGSPILNGNRAFTSSPGTNGSASSHTSTSTTTAAIAAASGSGSTSTKAASQWPSTDNSTNGNHHEGSNGSGGILRTSLMNGRSLPGQIGRFASPRSLSRGIHRSEPYSVSAAKDR